MARRVFTPLRLNIVVSPIPVLLRLKDGTVLQEEPGALSVVALHVTAVVPDRLHIDAAAGDRPGVGNT